MEMISDAKLQNSMMNIVRNKYQISLKTKKLIFNEFQGLFISVLELNIYKIDT